MAGSKDTFKSVIVLDENDIPGSILPRKSCLSAALSNHTDYTQVARETPIGVLFNLSESVILGLGK